MKKKKIDFIDLKILGALQASGRISKTQLSEDIGLSSTPCNERMRRLEDCDLIEGYYGDVNFELLDGYNFYWTTVNLKDYFSRSEEFEAFLMDMPEVFECYAILGQVDYQILIAARNVQEYQDILDKIINFDGQHVDFTSHPVTRRIKKRSDSTLIKVVEKRYREQNT